MPILAIFHLCPAKKHWGVPPRWGGIASGLGEAVEEGVQGPQPAQHLGPRPYWSHTWLFTSFLLNLPPL